MQSGLLLFQCDNDVMNVPTECPVGLPSAKELRRLVIVGCPAAGKSTLATLLGIALALPVIRRDSLGELGTQAYRDAINKMSDEPLWILDGPPFFEEDSVYRKADIILWLDTPKSTVIWWGIKRAFQEARTGGSLMQALHRTGGPVYAAYAFSSRRMHFTDILNTTNYKAKVAHVRPTRFVTRLPDVDRLVDALQKTKLKS